MTEQTKEQPSGRVDVFTVIGLLLCLGVPSVLVLTQLLDGLDRVPRAVVGEIIWWALAAAVLLIVRFGEDRPLESMGFRPLTRKEIGIAVGIGVVMGMCVPLTTWLVETLLPTTASDATGGLGSLPLWLVVLTILRAGIVEEILFRGFPIERLDEWLGRPLIAAAIPLIVFLALHLPAWEPVQLIAVTLPVALIITGLYLWKRNLWFTIIVHTVFDLPLIVIAILA